MVQMEDAKTTFQYIIVKESDLSLAGKEQNEAIPFTADKKAIFAGHGSNWKFSWKSIEAIDFIDSGMKLKTSIFSLECHVGDAGYTTFREFCEKRWNKCRAKMEPRNDDHPASQVQTKTRGVYGRRQYKTKLQKRHQSWGTNRITSDHFSSEDEKDAPVKEPPSYANEYRKEIAVSTDSGDIDHDEATIAEKQALDDTHDEDDKSPRRKRIKGHKKPRIQRKRFLDESDDEDTLFDDHPVMTTPKADRVVSPYAVKRIQCNDQGETGTDSITLYKLESCGEKPLSPSDSRGTKVLTNFFVKLPAKSSTTPKEYSRFKSLKLKRTIPTTSTVPRQDKDELQCRPNSPLQPDSGRPNTPTKSLTQNFVFSTEDYHNTSSQETLVESPAVDKKNKERFFHGTNKKDGKCIVDKGKNYENENSRLTVRRGWLPSSSPRQHPGLQDDDLVDDSGDSQPLCVAESVLNSSKLQHQFLSSASTNVQKPPNLPACSFLWKGLRNMGNSCYLNSSLQMLFTVTMFISQLSHHGGKLASSLVAVANKLAEKSEMSSITPKPVKLAIDSVTHKFHGNEQRDAHEFLSDLIDRVHDELVQGRTEKANDDFDTLPTDEFFRLNVKACLKCDSCGYERCVNLKVLYCSFLLSLSRDASFCHRTMDEMYRHLSIEVEEPVRKGKDDDKEPETIKWTVQSGLQKFFEPEKRDIICERCSIGNTATQTLTVVNR